MTKTKKKLLVDIKSKKSLPQYTDAQLTEIAATVGLTLEQLKTVHRLAYNTYHYIGSDLAAARAEMEEAEDMSREEIVEVVLDANYLEMANLNKVPADIKEWLNTKTKKYDLDVVYAAVAAGFSYPKYE